MLSADPPERALVRSALARLDIDRLVVTVHDASFPARGGEDVGRGSPYSRASEEFFAFVAARGFDAVQFGPQGKTSPSNPSPYDGAVWARSPLSVALARLVDDPGCAGLLTADELAQATSTTPATSAAFVDHRHAWFATGAALARAHRRWQAQPGAFAAVAAAAPAFRASHAGWLEADALFEVLSEDHGTDDFSRWGSTAGPGAASDDIDRHLFWPLSPQAGGNGRAANRRTQLLRDHADRIDFHTFAQILLHVQHSGLRVRARRLGLRLYADFQVGLSPRDRWRHEGLFLPGYAIGAPPSRTNPQGQPWGYPVLDPSGFAGPALQLFDQRLQRLYQDFDGLRIDHPHGIVCPWVYRSEGLDTLAAVKAGARLFASPDLADHPALARHAIATRADLAPADEQRPRYADDWERHLNADQIVRYATLIDRVIDLARAHGIGHPDVCAEVLSTCPYPLARVLERHGLGRLRVVQKADPRNPADPYRTETATPADWVTLGTHDTRPILPVVTHWQQTGEAVPWARYLADRLVPQTADRALWAEATSRDTRRMVAALAADLFVGPARHVSLFFPDLLGMSERYNVPGTISPDNWVLRVPADFVDHHARAVADGSGIDLTAALATALLARAGGAAGDAADLAAQLAQPPQRHG